MQKNRISFFFAWTNSNTIFGLIKRTDLISKYMYNAQKTLFDSWCQFFLLCIVYCRFNRNWATHHSDVPMRRVLWFVFHTYICVMITEFSVCEIIQQIKRYKMRFLLHKRTKHVYHRDNAHEQHILEYWLYDQHSDVAYCENGENIVVVGKTPQYVGIYCVILSFVVQFMTTNNSRILYWAYCMVE